MILINNKYKYMFLFKDKNWIILQLLLLSLASAIHLNV